MIIGYSDKKVARLTKEAVAGGFSHFKMKVGADQADDIRRGKLIRSIIDDSQYLPPGVSPRDPNSEELRGKNAGPTGAVLMIDANQVWDVQQAIDYVKGLEEIKPWSVNSAFRLLVLLTSLTGLLKSLLPRMTSLGMPPLGKR